MSYKVVIDSCGELTQDMKESGHFESVPLSIDIDGYCVVDDDTFDQADFLKRVAASPNCPKSSCPSPEKYMETYHCKEERIYVITLSASLSGSYNSAVLGKNLYHEEQGEKKIHVFDSCGASVVQAAIGMKIVECEEAGMDFETIVDKVETYRDEATVYFVLESLETLRKNGRLTGLKAFVATALNIKPVMGATNQGIIYQLSQARGTNKALAKMVDIMVGEVKNPEQKVLGIAHCNCPERAQVVKELVEAKIKPKKIFIVNTRGISTLYANDGGIIMVV
ncbi:MAG: DegV family protein [Lachnospiraceae bacterium]